MADGYAMVDPNKLMLLTPGIDRKTGEYLDFGVPATVVANYLREQRVVPEKCDLNSILFLMTPAEDESKLNTLIAKLVKFKNLWDRDAPLAEVLPTLYAAHSERYAGYTLRQVCHEMHDFYREAQRQGAAAPCFRAESFPELAMSPKDAYEKLVGNEVDYVPLDAGPGPHLGDAGADLPAGHRRGRAGRALGRRARSRCSTTSSPSRNRSTASPDSTTKCRACTRNGWTGASVPHLRRARVAQSQTPRQESRDGRNPEEDERRAADVHRHRQHDGLGHHHAARQHGAGRARSRCCRGSSPRSARMAIAYGFAQAGMFNQRSGGLAAYAEDAYGKAGYFQVFFLYFLSLAIANVAVAISALGYLAAFFPWTGVHADDELPRRDRRCCG